ncbi:serine/threonine protein kinase [Streptomyces sp. A244]|uniref:serine/threonine-protein kinase n=1 Tax=Streptomyces sp. A244 TaxID=2137016 RepID=UPI000D1BE4B5|nr:serine/threonine-protein kinase [Streptomyces sp. A244]PTH86220.1 serine/threonine protein kinase [Streptomyces sp. A244]
MSTGEHGQADGTGRLLAGRYRVTAALGRGGMGVVWKAVDEVLGREVAVKELRTYTDAAGPELADLQLRMRREARAAARVRHPGVISVHDIAQVDGRPIIVMEMVDGPSLDDVLRERGTLDPGEAAGIGAKVMDALAAAHRAGVLHRDVKPANILLDRSGRVVLTDFGIATMDDPGDGSATHLTRSGELVGSLDYLAPERAQGADPGPASDIWALGATLYAAVEGSSPFRRTSTFSTLTAIVTEPLPEPRRAGSLAPVLQRLLDKRPESRPEADQARELLQAVADTGGTDTPTSSLQGPAAPHPRAETERSVPSVPPGFGPPQHSADSGTADAFGAAGAAGAPGAAEAAGAVGAGGPKPTGPGGPEPTGPGGPETTGPGHGAPQGHPTPQGIGPQGPGAVPQGFGPVDPGTTTSGVSSATAPANADRSAPRRKARVLLAAAAVTVVLAAAGTTVALLGDSGDSGDSGGKDNAARSGTAGAGPSDPGGADDGSNAPKSTPQGDDKGTDPAAKTGGKKDPEPTGRPTTSAPAKPTGGATGGATGGETPDGAASDGPTTPAPVCHPIGGGKYNCTVWKTADSYTASGTKVGILKAGTNYFYCQQNLGRRETAGEWTNVWWAKTDDDSGNTNVWFSDVYIKGGDNDAPVPGLPLC